MNVNVSGNELLKIFNECGVQGWPEKKMKFIRRDVRQLRDWYHDNVITVEEMQNINGFGKKRQQYVLEFISVFC